MSRRDVVTCRLCGIVWTAPQGLGKASYRSHYIEEHGDVEAERRRP